MSGIKKQQNTMLSMHFCSPIPDKSHFIIIVLH